MPFLPCVMFKRNVTYLMREIRIEILFLREILTERELIALSNTDIF